MSGKKRVLDTVIDFVMGNSERSIKKAVKDGKFSKMQVSRAKKALRERKAKNKALNKDVSKAIKTPTGTTKARRNVKQEKPKEKVREETRAGMRKRPENAATTVVGKKVGTKPKVDRKKLRAARKESAKRDPDFQSRLSREARQGGVEDARTFSEKRDTGVTREQAVDSMRGIYSIPEGGQSKLDAMADEIILKGKKTNKKHGGPIGTGKATRGFGKARYKG